MRFIFSYGLALVIVVLLAAWLATGSLVIPGMGPGKGETPVVQALEGKDGGPVTSALESTGLVKAEEHVDGPDPALSIAERQKETVGSEAPAKSVRIATYTMQAMAVEVPLRGRTKAKSVVSVMPETAGTVDSVAVEKGQKVAKGDLLCTLDPGTRKASVSQAEAALQQAKAGLDQAQTEYDTNKSLRDKGLAAANTAGGFESSLKAAQSAVAAAQAGLDNAKAEWNRIEVRASVAGVVQDPLASVGSMLSAAVPCATIVQLDPMLFIGNVPEAKIAYAKLGLPATIKTVTGDSVEGKVSYISETSDLATRSFPIEIEIPNADGKVRDGITAEATVNVGNAPAHLLPQSVLTLDDEGVIGVRVVEDSKVAFYPVTILRDTREGIWVTGLPPKVDVITVGQEFVQPGQVVKASYGPESDPATTKSEGTPS
jgi:membrane fusion protein, multidrug efflux system